MTEPATRRPAPPPPADPAHRVPGPAGRAAASLVVALFGVLLPALSATPASGHAAGQPPHANLSAEDRTVVIEWTALPDDAAAVGVAIGMLPEEAVEAYLGQLPVEELPTDEELRALSESPALREYLLDNVQVRQDGQACRGSAEPAADFVEDGATLEFACARTVEQAEVRITILHDKDPAYRTFLVDGTIQSAVLTAEAPAHTWDFTAAPTEEAPSRSSAWVSSPALAGGLALVLAGAVGSLRLRRRSRGRHARPRSKR